METRQYTKTSVAARFLNRIKNLSMTWAERDLVISRNYEYQQAVQEIKFFNNRGGTYHLLTGQTLSPAQPVWLNLISCRVV